MAELVRQKGAILEVNAHCRQPEMEAVGAGQCLTRDLAKLSDWIQEIKHTDVPLSVKVRAGVVNDIELAKTIGKAGADAIHIDTMDSGPSLVKKIRNVTTLKIIANNSIVDYQSAHKMFSMGADYVSVARAAMAGDVVLSEMLAEIQSYQEMVGWYNAPKHICAGGDLRGLAFCCTPVKDCPLHYVLKRAGIAQDEYVRVKGSFKGTKLGGGPDTCFGSMVWCCKITRPCPWRDSTLQDQGLSDVEYMRIKKQLAEELLSCRNLE
jgi:putative methanogenesis marker domain 9